MSGILSLYQKGGLGNISQLISIQKQIIAPLIWLLKLTLWLPCVQQYNPVQMPTSNMGRHLNWANDTHHLPGSTGLYI